MPRWVAPDEARQLYQRFSPAQDRVRTNLHYEKPAAFFERITGGEWNVYSANLWEGDPGDTASQEAKLDLLARLADIRPGQRILDVGCGWGGPLTYLCKRYGLRGVGLTLSPVQHATALRRIERHGVDAAVRLCHWADFEDHERFDVVMTDEVIVHFSDLGAYFVKVRDLLRGGGRMLNKELHFVHARYAEMSRAMAFVNEIYGDTGNYRTLAEELGLANDAGFDVQHVHQIPRVHYQCTLDRWLSNMHEHREELRALVGVDEYRRFRAYLKIVRSALGTSTMTLDVVVSVRAEELAGSPRPGPRHVQPM